MHSAVPLAHRHRVPLGTAATRRPGPWRQPAAPSVLYLVALVPPPPHATQQHRTAMTELAIDGFFMIWLQCFLDLGERRLHHHHSASELARQKCPSEGQALQHRCLKHYQVRSYHSASPPSLCRRPLRACRDSSVFGQLSGQLVRLQGL
ncbi:uncharacterized protein LOC125521245 isoform X3 [Triticum urartu]|uniref:uncharacterized protein LOC125521245 isoform X3 n=1 Tax=Triticum urartu TaxID=4572 RepID=UPI002043A5FF|nr:uncharacterized protein LOC125521245 isoform X3 [Triticum urartu]